MYFLGKIMGVNNRHVCVLYILIYPKRYFIRMPTSYFLRTEPVHIFDKRSGCTLPADLFVNNCNRRFLCSTEDILARAETPSASIFIVTTS